MKPYVSVFGEHPTAVFILLPLSWRQYFPPKRRNLSTKSHGVMSQNTTYVMPTAAENSDFNI